MIPPAVRRLLEYLQHRENCELRWYCAECSSHMDAPHSGHSFRSMADADPTQKGCTCGLSDTLADAAPAL